MKPRTKQTYSVKGGGGSPKGPTERWYQIDGGLRRDKHLIKCPSTLHLLESWRDVQDTARGRRAFSLDLQAVGGNSPPPVEEKNSNRLSLSLSLAF